MYARRSVNNASMPSISKGKLVICIDTGTTSAALAYAAVIGTRGRLPLSTTSNREPEPEVFADWEASCGNGDQYPLTALYYDKDQRDVLPTTGHKLSLVLEKPTSFDTERYFHGRLISMHGNEIQKLEKSEDILWNPRTGGVDMERLEYKTFDGEQTPTPKIQYATHVQMADVNCKDCIKVFSGDGKDQKSCGHLKVESITDVQQISANLSRSFGFPEPKQIQRKSKRPMDSRHNREQDEDFERPRKIATRSTTSSSNLPEVSAASISGMNRQNEAASPLPILVTDIEESEIKFQDDDGDLYGASSPRRL
ncbi:hypothetical protein NHQ30_002343 [Ciborinia camelliae]|nr:hypothetical protein NHQ30_002343 [Ciborinia camelliae]